MWGRRKTRFREQGFIGDDANGRSETGPPFKRSLGVLVFPDWEDLLGAGVAGCGSLSRSLPVQVQALPGLGVPWLGCRALADDDGTSLESKDRD